MKTKFLINHGFTRFYSGVKIEYGSMFIVIFENLNEGWYSEIYTDVSYNRLSYRMLSGKVLK